MQAESNAAKGPVTFVVFTYNEERRIEWAIKNFMHWGPILVVDNYSEDRTVEIARSYGCDILMNKNKGWVEDPETVAKVWAAVNTEWIYWGFADEWADEATLTAILDAAKSNKYQIINLARKNYYYGSFFEHAFAHRMNRVFKKNAIDFSTNTIHHFGTVTVPDNQIRQLGASKYFVHHFMANDAKSLLGSMDRYTDVDARSFTGSLSSIALIAKLLKTFLVEYFFRGAWRNGFTGLAFVLQHLYYKCLVSMKGYELSHSLNNGGAEELNDKRRSALLDAMNKSGDIRGTL